MKQQYETQVTVQGKGDSKAKAFADALSKVQQVLRARCALTITALNILLEQHGAQFVLAHGAGYPED